MPDVLNLDLTGLGEGDRQGVVTAGADSVQALLAERYPSSEGHSHDRFDFKPFEEWPDLKGWHVKARRGWFWGFVVSLVPGDFQLRGMTVSLKRDLAFNEAVIALAAVVGALAMVAGFVVLFTVGFDDYRQVLLPLLGGVAVGAALWGLLYVLTRPIVSMLVDESAVSAEEQALAEELRRILSQ